MTEARLWQAALPTPRVDDVTDTNGTEWTVSMWMTLGAVDVVVGERFVPVVDTAGADSRAAAWAVLVGRPKSGQWERVAFGVGPASSPMAGQSLAMVSVDGILDRLHDMADE